MVIKSLEDIVYAMLLGETNLIIPKEFQELLIKEIMKDNVLDEVNKIYYEMVKRK